MTVIVLSGIIVWLLFVLSDAFDDSKLYKDKYKWYSREYDSTKQELFETKKKLFNANQAKSKQTITINVDSDEVVSKVMTKVNEDIKAIKEREQIYIKVDGKEINADKLKEIIRKEGKGNKNIF